MEQPSNEKSINFVYPRLLPEIGEIERVAAALNQPKGEFVPRFLKATLQKKLEVLTEDMWRALENTDSYDIVRNDWKVVEELADSHGRDWKSLREKAEKGERLDAPVVVKVGDRLHLVSGNTRLMITRALGQAPHVLVVEMSES